MRGLRNSCAAISAFVRPPAARSGYAQLLRRELITRGGVAAARCLPACAQFRPSAFCPRRDAELFEGFKCGPQVGASICPASLAAQPLAVEQLSPGPIKRR